MMKQDSTLKNNLNSVVNIGTFLFKDKLSIISEG